MPWSVAKSSLHTTDATSSEWSTLQQSLVTYETMYVCSTISQLLCHLTPTPQSSAISNVVAGEPGWHSDYAPALVGPSTYLQRATHTGDVFLIAGPHCGDRTHSSRGAPSTNTSVLQ